MKEEGEDWDYKESIIGGQSMSEMMRGGRNGVPEKSSHVLLL